MTKKNKVGEEYSDVYTASFEDTFVKVETGEKIMLKPRVHVTKSESMFYTVLHKLKQAGRIDEVTRLHMEVNFYRRGYKLAA